MSARTIRRSHVRDLQRASRRRTATIATGAILGAGAVFAPGAEAASLLVTQLNDAASDGVCDANCTLRDAIGSANGNANADVITFQTGLTGTTTVATQLEILNDVSIQGPGAATIAVSGGDASRVFLIDPPPPSGPPTVDVSISGLTIEDGKTGPSVSPYDDDGGGIKAFFTNLTLDDLTFSGNHAEDEGGAVYIDDGNLALTHSRVSGNDAIRRGGGVASSSYDSSLRTQISNTTFTGNHAGDPAPTNPYGSPRGGAIGISGRFTISAVTMTGNSASQTFGAGPATGFGGAAQLNGKGGTNTFSDSTITGNHGGRYAGGLGITYADVVDSTVSGNDAPVGGGVVLGDNSSLRGTTVSGNLAAAGGGVYLEGLDGNASIRNSTITGNQATGTGPYEGLGGGVLAYSQEKYQGNPEPGRLTVRGTTIASNTASLGGAGIYAYSENQNPGDPFVELKGSIVADGIGTSDIGQNRPGAIASGFSLIENAGGVPLVGDPAGSNITGVDPALSPLADNGGPTKTMSLSPTSAAVDASQAFGLTTDQRGQARTVDSAASNAPLSDGTDMGAFEVQDASATGDDDVTAPQTKITKKPPKKLKAKGRKKQAKASFSFTGRDDRPGEVTFECRIDKGKFHTCVSPFKVKLPKGKHTFAVRAVDAAGNVDKSPAEATVKVKAKNK
jgi:predicted outer membrane repeat protein